MTRDELNQKLESFSRGPASLSHALRGFPKRMWCYKPSREGWGNLWSIHEIILHLADREANSYVQCRRFIAEPGALAADNDATHWASSLGYFHQSALGALEIIRVLRRMTFRLLAILPEEMWSHSAIYSGGSTMSLEEWLELEEGYIPRRIQQMQESYAAWLQLNPPRKSVSMRHSSVKSPATAA